MNPRPMLRVLSRATTLPADGRPRVEAMLRTMSRHVVAACEDEAFVRQAEWITGRGERSTSPVVRARRALRYVQSLRYVWDPVGVERMQTPQATMALRRGDCNSLAALLAAILAAVGISSRFIAIKEALEHPEWAHVYVEALLGSYWVAADPSPLGQGHRAISLALGRAPAVPIAPVYLESTDPAGQLHGFFDDIVDTIKRPIGEVLEQVRDVASLADKADQYLWNHMGSDARAVVAKIGPLVASYYVPYFGKELGELAVAWREQRRLSDEARKELRTQMEAALADLVKQGKVAPGAIDLDNETHVEALIYARQMPEAEQRAWLAAHGYAPNGQKKAPRPRRRVLALLPAAAIFAAPFVL